MALVLEHAADGEAGLNERSGAEDVSFFLTLDWTRQHFPIMVWARSS